LDNTQATAEKKPSPFIDLLVSIVIPSIILMQLSGPERLGPTAALIFALSFPVGWGMYELLKNKKKNWVAVIGVISVLLTGGIGLLQIDSKWLAVKEAAIPAAFGIGVLIASKLGFPIVRKLLFNPAIMNTERIDAELDKKGNRSAFEKRLDNANYFFVGTFAFSAVMNYLLATWIVQSDSGTEEFYRGTFDDYDGRDFFLYLAHSK